MSWADLFQAGRTVQLGLQGRPTVDEEHDLGLAVAIRRRQAASAIELGSQPTDQAGHPFPVSQTDHARRSGAVRRGCRARRRRRRDRRGGGDRAASGGRGQRPPCPVSSSCRCPRRRPPAGCRPGSASRPGTAPGRQDRPPAGTRPARHRRRGRRRHRPTSRPSAEVVEAQRGGQRRRPGLAGRPDAEPGCGGTGHRHQSGQVGGSGAGPPAADPSATRPANPRAAAAPATGRAGWLVIGPAIGGGTSQPVAGSSRAPGPRRSTPTPPAGPERARHRRHLHGHQLTGPEPDHGPAGHVPGQIGGPLVTDDVAGVVAILHPQADAQRRVGPDVLADHPGGSLRGQHEMHAEASSPLGHADQRGEEPGQLGGQRGELVDDHDQAGQYGGRAEGRRRARRDR